MKKMIILLLASMMILSILTSCEVEEPPKDSITYQTKSTPTTGNLTETSTTVDSTETTETTNPISSDKIVIGQDSWFQTSVFQKGWRYHEIELRGCQYQIPAKSLSQVSETNDYIKKAVTELFRYEEGTYEHSYFCALTGLSQYAALVDYHLFEECLFDYNLVDDFLENYVDPAYFQKPYENILYESYSILIAADFGLYPIHYSEVNKYGYYVKLYPITNKTDSVYYVDYRYHPAELQSRLSLLFADFDIRFATFASDLLKLSDEYPEYSGEFPVTEEMKEAAKAIIKACEVIPANKEKMMSKWEVYLNTRYIIPKVNISYEIIPDKATLKLTLDSAGNSFRFDMAFDPWIKDLQGGLPTSSPATLYIPLRYYFKNNGELSYTIVDSVGVEYPVSNKITLDFNAIKGNPIKFENPFLNAVFTKHFGGTYTDLDLCTVSVIDIRYHSSKDRYEPNEAGFLTPIITLTFHEEVGGGTVTYQYIDFFEENFAGEKPLELREDILKFPCLEDVQVYNVVGGHGKALFTEGQLEMLLEKNPYTAADFD